MDGYLQVFDSPKQGQVFLVRLGAKILAGIFLIAFVFLVFGDGVGNGSKIAGVTLGVMGIAIGLLAFSRPYLCPRCSHRMRIRKKEPVGAGGTPLLLLCDQCKCYIDLKIEEE